MKNPMRNLLALALIALCGALHAEEKADTKLPQAAQALIEKYDADIAKRTMELTAALSKLQDAVTKTGNLEGALAIKSVVEKLDKQAGTDVMGNKTAMSKPKAKFVGDWTISKGNYRSVWNLTPKGDVTNTEGNQGKWTQDGDKIKIEWDNGNAESFTVPDADNAKETVGVAVQGDVLHLHR